MKSKRSKPNRLRSWTLNRIKRKMMMFLIPYTKPFGEAWKAGLDKL
jgi:hypothetical protein